MAITVWKPNNRPNIVFSTLALALGGYCLVLLTAYFLQISFLLEIISSFSPYWAVINFIILFLSAVLLWRLKLSFIQARLLKLAALGMFTIFTISYSIPVLNFAFINPSIQTNATSKSQHLKIAFFNKLFSNQNYSEISDGIAQLNPDIIAFAEFFKADAKQIKALENYPHSIVTRSPSFRNETEMAIFSKLPITSSSKDPVAGLPSALIRVRPSESGPEINFLAVHTAAPITQRYFTARSKQLENLVKYINNQGLYSQNLVLAGDFNLTPWSANYRELSRKLPGLQNAAAGRGLQFTWSGFRGLANAQLDHIFYSGNVKMNNFQIAGTYGSDHHLLWANVEF